MEQKRCADSERDSLPKKCCPDQQRSSHMQDHGSEEKECAVYEQSSLFTALAEVASEASKINSTKRLHAPVLESNLLWYQRKAAGINIGTHGDGFHYNFRTRRGTQFQIDPDSLPSPKPKRQKHEQKKEFKLKQHEGEQEVCLYDPDESEASDVPKGYHLTQKIVNGLPVTFLREGEGQNNLQERKENASQHKDTPSEEPSTAPNGGEKAVIYSFFAQPLKKRYRDKISQ